MVLQKMHDTCIRDIDTTTEVDFAKKDHVVRRKNIPVKYETCEVTQTTKVGIPKSNKNRKKKKKDKRSQGNKKPQFQV